MVCGMVLVVPYVRMVPQPFAKGSRKNRGLMFGSTDVSGYIDVRKLVAER